MLSHSPEQAAIAAEIDRQLAEYDKGLCALLQGHWDPALYRHLSDLFDAMQMKASLLPKLTSSWSELLITRVDLTHALWSVRTPSRIDGHVVAFHARHKVLIAEVRRECQEYMVFGGRLRA
jgi:hypothetical protein